MCIGLNNSLKHILSLSHRNRDVLEDQVREYIQWVLASEKIYIIKHQCFHDKCFIFRDVLEDQAREYIRAIQWILHYYFNGVRSWSWYYPHHYAPYLSDLRNFSHLKLEYEMSQPFKTFQQLMAVLPSASKTLLPTSMQVSLCSECCISMHLLNNYHYIQV